MSTLPVRALSEWLYCPRQPWFQHCLGLPPLQTLKMSEGLAAQSDFERLELRRTLHRYGLDGRKREFRPLLVSEILGLSGQPDLLLESASAIAVVECKLTAAEPRDSDWLQLAAYAMLVEDVRRISVDQVMIYRLSDDTTIPKPFTEKWRERTQYWIGTVHSAIRDGLDPGPTAEPSRCHSCTWANFCGDIW